ncbi:hypothetical protein MCOR03_001038 [Pyricularia oryzae]|nr:hypothetical protein MCOR03_001038 [Pyricularia oryzae]
MILPRVLLWTISATCALMTECLTFFSYKSGLSPQIIVDQMRLIDTNTIEVIEFTDDKIPQYAILSHTWGAEEVSYQDMQRLATNRKRKSWDLGRSPSSSSTASVAMAIFEMSGYIKIKAASHYARAHGFRYLWVDTCCIDKTSSAELSEAINSMFVWYRDAALCFAYLEDVPNRQLKDSRWFTRGWTLQELIAPRQMIFCSSNWNEVGRKSSSNFCDLLATITGVDRRVLRGNINLDEISVANRMRWAANRKTTRREDMAYCLMGIFSVNMPLLYGEGGIRAFIRLQEEIMKDTDDHSIFAWAAQPLSDNPLHGLLASSPAAFADAQTIRRLPPLQTSDSVPMSMTNQGLRLKVFLWSVPEYLDDLRRYLPRDSVVTSQELSLPLDGYFAFLECSVIENGEFLCPVILLRNLWGDQYARINIDMVYHLRDPRTYSLDRPGSGYCSIYVKRSPREILPDFIVALEKGLGSYDDRITFVEQALPPESWDPASFVLTPRPVGPSKTTVATIRFADSARKSCLDVSVGLIKVSHGWEPWCRQSHHVSRSLWDVHKELVDALWNSEMPQQLWEAGDTMGTVAQTRLTTRYGRPYVLLEFVQRFEIDGTEIFQPEDNINAAIQTAIEAAKKVLPEPKDGWISDLEATDLVEELHHASEDDIINIVHESQQGLTGFNRLHLALATGSCKLFDRCISEDMTKPPYGRQETVADLIAFLLGDVYQTGVSLPPDQAAVKAILALDPLSARKLDSRGYSVLWHAARGGDASRMAWLLRDGFTIEAMCRDGRRPIHAACREGYSNVVKVLLESGARADVKEPSFGLTPAHLAAMFGHHECLEHIIGHSSGSVDETLKGRKMYCTPLHLAVANGRTKCVEVLLEAGVDVSRRCGCYFVSFIEAHSIKKPESFDVVAANELPGNIAAERGFDQIMELISRRGREAAKSPLSPRAMSFEREDVWVVRSVSAPSGTGLAPESS